MCFRFHQNTGLHVQNISHSWLNQNNKHMYKPKYCIKAIAYIVKNNANHQHVANIVKLFVSVAHIQTHKANSNQPCMPSLQSMGYMPHTYAMNVIVTLMETQPHCKYTAIHDKVNILKGAIRDVQDIHKYCSRPICFYSTYICTWTLGIINYY